MGIQSNVRVWVFTYSQLTPATVKVHNDTTSAEIVLTTDEFRHSSDDTLIIYHHQDIVEQC